MSSISLCDDLTTYARSRLAAPRIMLLWLALAACSLWLAHDFTFSTAAISSTVLMALLVVQFRLWDDLSDRKHDVLRHPQRVLVNTVHIKGFVWLCAGLALPITLLMTDMIHALVYIGLLAAFAILYVSAQARLLRAHLVLLKYPVFIWLCVPVADLEHWLRTGMVVYLLLCVYDMLSDAELRTGSRWLVTFELAACAALFIF